MLGQTLVTKQSMYSTGAFIFRASLEQSPHCRLRFVRAAGAEGRKCEKVLLMERLYMRREMYLSILMDR